MYTGRTKGVFVQVILRMLREVGSDTSRIRDKGNEQQSEGSQINEGEKEKSRWCG